MMAALACRIKRLLEEDASSPLTAATAAHDAKTKGPVTDYWSILSRRYWRRAKRAIDLEPKPGLMTGTFRVSFTNFSLSVLCSKIHILPIPILGFQSRHVS
jgi:hypothetical protein